MRTQKLINYKDLNTTLYIFKSKQQTGNKICNKYGWQRVNSQYNKVFRQIYENHLVPIENT